MDEKVNNEILQAALAEQIFSVMSRPETEGLQPAKAYRIALGSMIECLLDTSITRSNDSDFGNNTLLQQLCPLEPADVGSVYEYLRGFTVKPRPGKIPELTSCVQGKRNQGLFYTPHRIVSHIVHRSLDELKIGRPEEYLDVRILDPAAGTGRFLVEALCQLSERVSVAQSKGNTILNARLEEIRENVRKNITALRLSSDLDWQIALRIHIAEKCLYGVDLDPIAIRIARAVLAKRAFGANKTATTLISSHIVFGNALMGTGRADPRGLLQQEEDLRHAKAYFGSSYKDRFNKNWASSKGLLHWPLRFPEVFSGARSGFDAVIGNPPYEILSVKESGISERRLEQSYYRKIHSTCRGKINTYRLMLERGIDVLREGGTLGFIVPATLLSDSTASKLRGMILDSSRIIEATVIPEKARAFKGVTQAYLVLITRKGESTERVAPTVWDGKSALGTECGTSVDRHLIERLGLRIPVVRDEREKALLEALTKHPPLGGEKDIPPAASVHQGEINMTVHRRFLTTQATDYPLIRGEHVQRFNVVHPSLRGNRFDWVHPDFFINGPGTAVASPEEREKKTSSFRTSTRFELRKQARIVLGRAVNMDSHRRLKAAAVHPGAFLGDMTNFLTEMTVSSSYLLGLLNSDLLNWRIKLTSTNNYLSAAEVLALPIPRLEGEHSQRCVSIARQLLDDAFEVRPKSLFQCVEVLTEALRGVPGRREILVSMIERTCECVQLSRSAKGTDVEPAMLHVLDGLILMLYEAAEYSAVLDS